jgi:hypothetical protein
MLQHLTGGGWGLCHSTYSLKHLRERFPGRCSVRARNHRISFAV